MADHPVFTYQTRLSADTAMEAVLSAYADLYGQVERSLFAALAAGGNANKLKPEFQRRFGLTARQYNAVAINLKGKIASIQARRPELIREAEARIAKAKKVIARLEKQAKGSNKLHQKKRRLYALESRLASLRADQAAGTVRLCFGSRKLFRAQFALESNGYENHAQWKSDWIAARSAQFYVIGSKDETAGCQGCVAVAREDGAFDLRLRLPDALARTGKHVVLTSVRFAYGHDVILAALKTGTALSYRFRRDEKGWRVFVSAEAATVRSVTHRLMGAVGVDINADHLAVSETDRFGNLVGCRRIALALYGKSTTQAKALIGDAAVAIAAQAATAGKPLVVEKLDFSKKKAALEASDPAKARMLSSFACNQILSHLKAAAFRAGVEVLEVNPAYTSVIGAVNHARGRGISPHQGAAYAIARRGLGLSERPTVREAAVPTRNGGHVAFPLPVRNRGKHVWSFWSGVRTRLRAAHVAHVRSGLSKEMPAPLSPEMRALGATWTFTAKSRDANRFQHCSGSVLDNDVPY